MVYLKNAVATENISPQLDENNVFIHSFIMTCYSRFPDFLSIEAVFLSKQ